MRDPKFGYHALWIVPLAIMVGAYQETSEAISRAKHRHKMKKIKRDPEISTLSRLSGIKD